MRAQIRINRRREYDIAVEGVEVRPTQPRLSSGIIFICAKWPNVQGCGAPGTLDSVKDDGAVPGDPVVACAAPTAPHSWQFDLPTHTRERAPHNKYSPEASCLDPNPTIRSARPRTAGCGSILAPVNRNSCKSNAGTPGSLSYPQRVR